MTDPVKSETIMGSNLLDETRFSVLFRSHLA